MMFDEGNESMLTTKKEIIDVLDKILKTYRSVILVP